jgi:hypothetical protein
MTLLVISLCAIFVAAASVIRCLWYLIKVFRKINTQTPLLAYALGPFMLTKRFIGEDGHVAIRKFWKSAGCLVFALIVIAATYPFA